MKISARNTLNGIIKSIVPGSINSEITVEVAPGVEIVGIITKASADKLGLKQGQAVYAVIKSSDVMIATD
jgi:molybdopterin-binding protein